MIIFFSRLWLLCVSLCLFSIGYAQPDTSLNYYNQQYNQLRSRAMENVNVNRPDSALVYVLQLEQLVVQRFGDSSLAHAQALGGAIGPVYNRMSDHVHSYQAYKRAMQLYKAFHDTANATYANSIFGVAKAAITIGGNKMQEVPELLQQSAAIFKAQREWRLYANSMLLQGNLYISGADYDKALKIYETIEQTLDTIPKTLAIYFIYTSLYNNTSAIYDQTGNYKKAMQLMQKARSMARYIESTDKNTYPMVLLNLAKRYVANLMYDSAVLALKEAADSIAKWPTAQARAELYRQQGEYYWHLLQWNNAKNSTLAYVQLMDSLHIQPSSYNGTLKNLAVLYMKTHEDAKADSLFKERIALHRRYGDTSSYIMQELLFGLAENSVMTGRYKPALDSLLSLGNQIASWRDKNLPALTEADQLHYKATFDDIFHLIYQCLIKDKSGAAPYATAVLNLQLQRNGLLLDNWVNILNRVKNSKDPTVQQQYQTWLQKRKLLSNNAADAPAKATALQADIEVIEKGFAAGTTPIRLESTSWKKIVQSQNVHTANIEFIQYSYARPDETDSVCYAAFVFNKKDTAPHFLPLCSNDILTKLMSDRQGKKLEAATLTRLLYEKGPVANRLYQLIWQPLQLYLKGITTVHYITAGQMNDISFAALNNNGKYLVENYTLRRLFSHRRTDDEAKQPKTVPNTIQIWSNINYGKATAATDSASLYVKKQPARTNAQNRSPKPFANFYTADAGQLKQLFIRYGKSVHITQKDTATEDYFKKAAAQMNGLLHISTHGFYIPTVATSTADENTVIANLAASENPLQRCGLALANINPYWLTGTTAASENGLLTGYEVAQLNLQKVRMVTLSACETGLGDITDTEGNLGLARAFKLAGVKTVLVSLWPVPVKQTGELMNLFYTNWLTGTTPSAALQQASNSLQQKGYPPFYWAGFVLVE